MTKQVTFDCPILHATYCVQIAPSQSPAETMAQVAAAFCTITSSIVIIDHSGQKINSFDNIPNGYRLFVIPASAYDQNLLKSDHNIQATNRYQKSEQRYTRDAADTGPATMDPEATRLGGVFAKGKANPNRPTVDSLGEDERLEKPADTSASDLADPSLEQQPPELVLTGDMDEFRDEYLLVRKQNEEGYDGFGSQKLIDIIQENWESWIVEFLKPESLQPKMVPHVPEWIMKDLRRKGESLEEYEADVRKERKSVLDWGVPIISHLAFLSEYTRGQGDAVLRLLNEAVDGRVQRARSEAKKNPELHVEDIKRVIEDILIEHEVPF